MPLTGYQDWQRVNYLGGFNLLNVFTAVTVNTSFGPFNVQAWSSIQANLFAPGGADHYQVRFSFWADAAQTTLLATPFEIIAPNSLSSIPIPVQGPYMTVIVNPKVGGNATAVAFTFYGVTYSDTPFQVGLFSTPFITDNSAYAINGAKTFTVTAIYAGRVHFECKVQSANPAKARLEYYDFGSGTFIPYIRFGDIASNITLTEELPLVAGPVQIVVTNGGVAQSIFTSMTPLP